MRFIETYNGTFINTAHIVMMSVEYNTGASCWAVMVALQTGHDVYLSVHETHDTAEQALNRLVKDLNNGN